MAQKNIAIWIILAILAIAVLFLVGKQFGLYATLAVPTLSRTVPQIAAPSSSFTVTYATSGAPSTKWFVAWEDTITGGCTPTPYKSFIGSETGGDESKTKTFTAPSSTGTCTFTGYYQYTGQSQVNFPTANVIICGDTCSSLGYVCGMQTVCTIQQNCGTCSTGKLCKTTSCAAPTFSELINFANQWVSGTITFQQLMDYANAWVTG